MSGKHSTDKEIRELSERWHRLMGGLEAATAEQAREMAAELERVRARIADLALAMWRGAYADESAVPCGS